jgi:uncharacterized surface protein with fasciclin (FAS1) repeats
MTPRFTPSAGPSVDASLNPLLEAVKMKARNIFASAAAIALMGAAAPTFAQSYMQESRPDIVEVATSAGSFTTLVTALKAAGLVEVLQGKGPFTVFAPTDEAFAKLPAGTVEDLLKPENKEKLQAILTYHVVAGRVMASDVAGISSAETVQGQSLTVSVQNGAPMVDNAKIIQTDIAASNGVIHVIDSVVIPSSN